MTRHEELRRVIILSKQTIAITKLTILKCEEEIAATEDYEIDLETPCDK